MVTTSPLSTIKRPLLAEPSTPSPVRTPASIYFLIGAMPEASRILEDGQMADAGALLREETHLVIIDMHGMRIPDVLAHQPSDSI